MHISFAQLVEIFCHDLYDVDSERRMLAHQIQKCFSIPPQRLASLSCLHRNRVRARRQECLYAKHLAGIEKTEERANPTDGHLITTQPAGSKQIEIVFRIAFPEQEGSRIYGSSMGHFQAGIYLGS